MKLIAIAARSLNGIIGNKGAIPWKIPSEMKFFKEQTTGHVVIMGRKTYESIGKPLPNRVNIVLSSKPTTSEGVIHAYSVEEVLNMLPHLEHSKAFVIGGEQIYKAFLPYYEEIILSTVNQKVDGDTYFPEFDEGVFRCKEYNSHNLKFGWTYVHYKKECN